MQCPRCPSFLPALELGEHIGRIHVGKVVSLWICADCPFESAFIYDAVAHCLSEDHDPQALRCSVPQQLLELAKLAQRFPTTGIDSRAAADPPTPYSVPAPAFPIPEDSMPSYSNSADYVCPAPLTPKSTRKRMRKLFSESNPLYRAVDNRQRTPLGVDHGANSNTTNVSRKQSVPIEIDENPFHASGVEYDSEENGSTAMQSDNNNISLIGSEKVPWVCRQCSALVKETQNGTTSHLISHVLSCTKVKPYACSGCGYDSRSKFYVKKHMIQCKNGASIVLPAKERNEAQIRKGISNCFPSFDCNVWGGLKL